MHQGSLGWVGIVLLALGLSVAAGLAFTEKGPVRRAYNRYLGYLDRQRRALFLKPSAKLIVLYQVLALLLVLTWAACVDTQAVVLAPVVAFGPRLLFPVLRRRRVQRIEDQLDTWLTVVSNMLQVTASLAEALRQSLDLTRGPLGEEIDLLLKEVKLGMPLPGALRAMSDRVASDLLANIVTVLVIGRTSGGALPTLLEEIANTLRERKRLEGVIRKHTAGARNQLLAMAFSPFLVIYVMKKQDPNYFDPMFSDALGIILVAVAVVSWLGGVVLARKVLAVDT